MGALTSNRKRGDDYFKSLVSISTPIDHPYGHIAKKSKLSVSMDQNSPALSSKSIVSRIFGYPERKSEFKREVHAPVRNSRFGFSFSGKNCEVTARSRESPDNSMGGFTFSWRILTQKYKKAKNSAVRSLRHVVIEKQKEKEVIEIDSDDENRNDVSDDSDDSSIEEVKILGSKWMDGQGAGGNLREKNVKTVEKEMLDSSVVTDVSNGILKVHDGERAGLGLLDQVPDDDGLSAYKRLLGRTKERDPKLASLQFQIDHSAKKIERLHLLRPKRKEEKIKKDVAEECFLPLSEEEKSEISHAFSNSNRRKNLVRHENSGIDITVKILQCLRPGAWLNDEVINLYLELLNEREKRDPQKFLKCHFFNTFFYKKLISGRDGYDFQSVRRWTTKRKLGYSLLECDKIFVPIHQEIHWCLAIINKKDKKFQYLDSLGGVDSHVLPILARYFVDEVKDKCGEDINVSSWEQEFVENLPEQKNGFDCGMFMIKYADFYSRDIGLCFGQEHMPYFRLRTAKEILRKRAD